MSDLTHEKIVHNDDLDFIVLDRLLDKAKAKVFVGKNSAFLGSVMCATNFIWASDIHTACTNGLTIEFNPYFFLNLPEDTRTTVILHEIWHVALMHMVRRADRDPEIWNFACDIVINNMLYRDGHSFKGFSPWIDLNYGDQAAEEVYEALIQLPGNIIPQSPWGAGNNQNRQGPPIGDMVEPDPWQSPQIINRVVAAAHTAKLAGDHPGGVEVMLKRFLQPKVPWETLIHQWMNDLIDQDYSMSKPNRRYRNQDLYLPSLIDDEGRLEHLVYYQDVSGSVSDKDVLRFNSEIKYIKESFNPKLLTVVLFDTRITKTMVFKEEDTFDEIVIVGRGGTDFRCVHNHICELNPKPTAAIIFSDMGATPMPTLPGDKDIPILWVGVNADTNHKIQTGRIIYIRE